MGIAGVTMLTGNADLRLHHRSPTESEAELHELLHVRGFWVLPKERLVDAFVHRSSKIC